MKKFLLMILSIMTMILFTACGETKTENTDQKSETEKVASSSQATTAEANKQSKILVAFFSHTGENYQVGVIEKGNTHIMADMIVETTKADKFEIKTVKPYPKTYQECTEVAKQELAENARPELSTRIDDISNYDTIFLGYPIWWSDMPPAIYTFLESYDFNGKTIIPFCTSAGTYMTGKEVNIPQIAKGSTIRDGLGVVGKDCQDDPEKVREAVNQWLASLGY
ncbi:MAG: NAD(P)H-dependent oxidoreductase [Selenomonadaceae bacterium]|nr:NAD(P)H-dependent oxidoreductase [Selenomonadaceae bacterium]